MVERHRNWQLPLDKSLKFWVTNRHLKPREIMRKDGTYVDHSYVSFCTFGNLIYKPRDIFFVASARHIAITLCSLDCNVSHFSRVTSEVLVTALLAQTLIRSPYKWWC